MKIKSALCSLLLAAVLASHAAAGNYYVDVIECSNPPWALEWATVSVQVSVWRDANWFGNYSYRKIGIMLGQARSTEARLLLSGAPTMWHAAIPSGSQRIRGYDGKWYLVRWGHVSSYNNKGISNVTTLHPYFTWKLDPDH